MNPTPSRATAAALTVALALTACSNTHRGGAQTSPQPATSAQGRSAPTAKAQADSIRHPYTQADVDFMSHMIGHHAQALVMSGWAPTHGASSSVRILAERIINGQQDEIVTMQRWLRDRGKPVPAARPMAMKMKMNGKEHEMLMPGMLTDDQMNELEQARGPEFDRLFLTYMIQHHRGKPVPAARPMAMKMKMNGKEHEMLMPGMLTDDQMNELEQARGAEFDRLFLTCMIQHHRGAVTMVKDLLGTYGAAQDETVFKFANDVSVDQSTEIARMERMLAAPSPGAGAP